LILLQMPSICLMEAVELRKDKGARTGVLGVGRVDGRGAGSGFR
jgi:hypothetical protein